MSYPDKNPPKCQQKRHENASSNNDSSCQSRMILPIKDGVDVSKIIDYYFMILYFIISTKNFGGRVWVKAI